MCVEDITIARLSVGQRTAVPANTPTRFPANPDRIALIATTTTGANSTISLAQNQADATAKSGFALLEVGDLTVGQTVGRGDIIVTYHLYGRLVFGEIWVNFDSQPGVVTEVLMNKELAQKVNDKQKEIINGFRQPPPNPIT